MSRKGDNGFTLIELLVVILIVAILAAVAIPMFYRQREKAYEDQIRSDLKNAALAVETYAVDNGGDYSGLHGLTGADLIDQGFNMPAYLSYLEIRATPTHYCLQARHGDLQATSAWRRSTFQSRLGEPRPTPDNCPAAI